MNGLKAIGLTVMLIGNEKTRPVTYEAFSTGIFGMTCVMPTVTSPYYAVIRAFESESCIDPAWASPDWEKAMIPHASFTVTP